MEPVAGVSLADLLDCQFQRLFLGPTQHVDPFPQLNLEEEKPGQPNGPPRPPFLRCGDLESRLIPTRWQYVQTFSPLVITGEEWALPWVVRHARQTADHAASSVFPAPAPVL